MAIFESAVGVVPFPFTVGTLTGTEDIYIFGRSGRNGLYSPVGTLRPIHLQAWGNVSVNVATAHLIFSLEWDASDTIRFDTLNVAASSSGAFRTEAALDSTIQAEFDPASHLVLRARMTTAGADATVIEIGGVLWCQIMDHARRAAP